ncbi:MAG: ferritin [Thermoanaerobaculia bacterium]
MQLSEELTTAMNRQVGHELAASSQYIAIAAHFDVQALSRLADFFYRQSDEEREHAMKFVHFIVEAGGALEIPVVPAPTSRFASAAEAVALAVASEERVTRQIYALMDQAKSDSDYIAQRFLDWFVDEQFEEMSTMGDLLQVVERAGEDQLLRVEEYLERGGPEGPTGGEEE